MAVYKHDCKVCDGSRVVGSRDRPCGACKETGNDISNCCSKCYGVGRIDSMYSSYTRAGNNTVECNNCNGTGKRSSLCFISTACLESIGKEDNCYELELLRKYRDTWLTKNYPTEIVSYYENAPMIVKEIDKQEDKELVYKSLWTKNIKPCVELIENKEYEKARFIYKKTVLKLMCDFSLLKL